MQPHPFVLYDGLTAPGSALLIMRRTRRLCALVDFLKAAAVFLPLIPVNAGSVYVETGAGYKSGDFGSPVETRLGSIFTKVGYFTQHYEFNISAPYLFLRNETDAGHDMQSGFGDAVLRAGASLIGRTPNGYSLYGSASVKLPTADPDKGLGTGEADYGISFTSIPQGRVP